MSQFLETLSRPDNLPVAGMFVVMIFLLGVWWREARKHDKRIEDGEPDKIEQDMRR